MTKLHFPLKQQNIEAHKDVQQNILKAVENVALLKQNLTAMQRYEDAIRMRDVELILENAKLALSKTRGFDNE